MEKIYTISEIGKLLGLSNDAIRFMKERTGSSRYQSRKQISHVYDTKCTGATGYYLLPPS